MNAAKHAECNLLTLNNNARMQGGKKHFAISGAVLGENIHFNRNMQATIDDGLTDIIDQAQRYKNNSLDTRTGFVAEADHCATFNVRKALERDSTRAVREPNGNHGDYKIVKNGKILVEGEVKYHKSAERTETAMRGYGERQLVGPSDQVDEIKQIASQKAAKGKVSPKESRQRVGLEHETVGNNVSPSITDGKTESTPRTRNEAKTIARKATEGDLNSKDILPSLGESTRIAMKSGAQAGAATGALINGIMSGGSNLTCWVKGEKSGEDALVDTATDVVIGSIDGGIKGAVGSGATVLATHAASRVASTAIKSLLRGGAPAAAAIGCIEIGKDAVDLVAGKIDGERFCEKSIKTGATTIVSWAGAEAGMILLSPLGPAGVAVGAIVGGMLSAWGIGRLFE